MSDSMKKHRNENKIDTNRNFSLFINYFNKTLHPL